jgi:1-acyl-sn-glycerol-3-phosphate acyltransferase
MSKAPFPRHNLRSFIGSVGYLLFSALTVVPYGIAVVLVSLIDGDRGYWVAAAWLRLQIWAARVISGIEPRVQGRENLPDAPVILCPKHQSAWETYAMPVMMPRALCYVFKRELLWIPFFGWSIGMIRMIPIDRSKRSEAFNKVATIGLERFKEGRWIIMFPEGTRIARGKVGNYKVGAARIATLTGAPIVPIAVASARCWPRHWFHKFPGVVDVSIGKPIASVVNGVAREPDELMREVQQWIETEMHRIDPQAYKAS